MWIIGLKGESLKAAPTPCVAIHEGIFLFQVYKCKGDVTVELIWFELSPSRGASEDTDDSEGYSECEGGVLGSQG